MINELEVLDRLAQIELFQDFARFTKENDEALRQILAVLEPKNFTPGENIISEGTDGDSLFILLDGDVRILRKTTGGDEFAVANLSAAQNIFFGEIALLDHEKRSATVIALTGCETFELTRCNYLKLCEKNSYIGFKVTFQIARRLSGFLRKANVDRTTLYQALLEEIDN